mmetsp:Transcript_25947/g.66020  ORF Transcript_25947/g.66020 Transcript_25947/m.66020 type:complete len:206 (+) Transcript_25947:429-1046(+)
MIFFRAKSTVGSCLPVSPESCICRAMCRCTKLESSLRSIASKDTAVSSPSSSSSPFVMVSKSVSARSITWSVLIFRSPSCSSSRLMVPLSDVSRVRKRTAMPEDSSSLLLCMTSFARRGSRGFSARGLTFSSMLLLCMLSFSASVAIVKLSRSTATTTLRRVRDTKIWKLEKKTTISVLSCPWDTPELLLSRVAQDVPSSAHDCT